MNEGKPAKAEPKAEIKPDPKPAAVIAHSYPTWFYHSENAPGGKLCHHSDHHKGEGWVDTPAKFPKAKA